MGAMDEPSQGPASSPEAVFLRGLDRLARPDAGGSSPFHRTRSPFIRLRDVLAGVRADRPPAHPASCQDQTCGRPLTEGYYRRADGFTLCGACFERWQQDGRVREATEAGSPRMEGP